MVWGHLHPRLLAMVWVAAGISNISKTLTLVTPSLKFRKCQTLFHNRYINFYYCDNRHNDDAHHYYDTPIITTVFYLQLSASPPGLHADYLQLEAIYMHAWDSYMSPHAIVEDPDFSRPATWSSFDSGTRGCGGYSTLLPELMPPHYPLCVSRGQSMARPTPTIMHDGASCHDTAWFPIDPYPCVWHLGIKPWVWAPAKLAGPLISATKGICCRNQEGD